MAWGVGAPSLQGQFMRSYTTGKRILRLNHILSPSDARFSAPPKLIGTRGVLDNAHPSPSVPCLRFNGSTEDTIDTNFRQ